MLMNGVRDKEMSTSKFNKLISLLMAVLIVFTMMPSMAFAEGSGSVTGNAAAPVLKTRLIARTALTDCSYANRKWTK